MAQRALARVWPILRGLLIGVGVGVLLAVLLHMVEFLVGRSDDAREKLYLSVLDKLFLGVAAAGVGYWLQQRLEIFKRNQSLTAEKAKAQIAAYNKVISAVTVLEFHVRLLVPRLVEMKELVQRGQEELEAAERDLSTVNERVPITTTEEGRAELLKMLEGASNKIRKAREEVATGEQAMDEAGKEYDEKSREFIRLVSTEQHLLGDGFKNAALLLGQKLHAAVASASSNKPPDAVEEARLTLERARLRKAVILSLPPFARFPADELQFNEPDLEAVLEEVARKYPAPKKKPEPPKGEAP